MPVPSTLYLKCLAVTPWWMQMNGRYHSRHIQSFVTSTARVQAVLPNLLLLLISARRRGYAQRMMAMGVARHCFSVRVDLNPLLLLRRALERPRKLVEHSMT